MAGAAREVAQHEVEAVPVVDRHRLIGTAREPEVAEHASREQVGHVVRRLDAD